MSHVVVVGCNCTSVCPGIDPPNRDSLSQWVEPAKEQVASDDDDDDWIGMDGWLFERLECV